jgi:hypothetical protein
MTETPDESDQLTEEAPPEVVPDDDHGSAEGEGESESPGVPGEEETGTGNPDNAGADE